MLDEFLKENVLKNGEGIREELADFIYKPNIQQIFNQQPSSNTTEQNIEWNCDGNKSSILNETPQPAKPPKDLLSPQMELEPIFFSKEFEIKEMKVSPIRMACTKVENVIKEEASLEE